MTLWTGVWGEGVVAVQDLATLSAAVRNYLIELHQSDPSPPEVVVSDPDPRLRLVRCPLPLETTLAPGSQPTGRTTVAVHCAGSKPWTVYLPGQVRVSEPVLVTTRFLTKGEEITSADVTVERRDTAGLAASYLREPGEAIGKALTRPVQRGSLLLPNYLQVPRVVQRGERVTLMVEIGGLVVRSEGITLGDAGLGERVQVRNESSKRVIEGTVASPGMVRVNP